MVLDLVPTEYHEVVQLPDRETARMQLARVEDFKRVVRELFIPGHDFGTIPGTGDKPTLLKPGAEKLIKLLGLADTYAFIDKVEEWERGFFNYTVKCSLVSLGTGQIVAEGMGNCNSWESKYRYRWAWPNEIPEAERAGKKTRQVRARGQMTTQYRIENDDIASSVNTILKMAKKRAQMDAALSAGRLSDVFTQDIEEIAENRQAARGEIADEPASETPATPRAAAAPKPQNGNGQASEKSPLRTGLESAWGGLWNRATAVGLKDNTIISKLSDEELQAKYNELSDRLRQHEHGQNQADTAEGTAELPFEP